MLLEQMILLVFGIVLIILGFCFMAWGVTHNKQKNKGVTDGVDSLTKLLEALGKLVDIIAKHVPNAVVGLGLLMMVIGLFLIIFAFYIPVIPNLAGVNTTQ